MDDQLSFLSDLDLASDTRKPNLCTTWKNAIMNDCGVFTVNRMGFESAADIPVERRREIYTVINDAVTGATK